MILIFCLSPRLHSLLSLSLHNNLLTFLPRELLSLVHLQELSLRGNPLVVRFIKDITNDPPSLLELAGRTIKSHNVPFLVSDLPANLCRYLNSASKCPNPRCAGTVRNRSMEDRVQDWCVYEHMFVFQTALKIWRHSWCILGYDPEPEQINNTPKQTK